MNELRGERETKLREEIGRLRAALTFYADIETYRGHGMQDAVIIHDGGQIARDALGTKATVEPVPILSNGDNEGEKSQ